MNVEYITVPFEMKSLESGQFEGYGSTFGNVDLGGDVVMKGAFKESLAEYRKAGEWPQMFWMHRPDQIPGKWVDMREDDKGLKVKGELLDTTVGKDVGILMRAKAVRANSIGFSIDSQDDYEFRDGVRLIHRANLWEVSPVSMPMNPKARITAVKTMLHAKGVTLSDLKRELEAFFREKGLSKAQSISFASRAFSDEDGFAEIDFGAMPKSRNGGEPGAKLDEPRRDAGEAEALVAKALAKLAERISAS